MSNIKKIFPFIISFWAAFCPLCYLTPVLIGVGAGGALASIAFFSEKLLIILIFICIIIFYFNYKVHKNIFPILLGVVSGGIMYYSRFINYNLLMLYLGSFFMSATAITDLFLKRKIGCLTCNNNVSKKNL